MFRKREKFGEMIDLSVGVASARIGSRRKIRGFRVYSWQPSLIESGSKFAITGNRNNPKRMVM